MQRHHSADLSIPGPSSSLASSRSLPRTLQDNHTSPVDPRVHRHLASSPCSFDSCPCSSSSKLPQLSSGAGTTPPDLAQSPRTPSPNASAAPQDPAQVPDGPLSSREPPPSDGYAPSISSESDEQTGAPTRASICAWVKATPAGPPRNTPSPADSAVLAQSNSDDNLDRQSITRSAGHQTISSVSHSSGSSSSRNGSSDERGSSDNALGEDSSGNIADVESSGSGGDMTSPTEASDPSEESSPPSLPTRQALHPPPMQQHTQSSASDSPPPAIIITRVPQQDQQERLDRRRERLLPSRRRIRERDHRERERRARASNPTPPSNVPPPSNIPPPSNVPPLAPAPAQLSMAARLPAPLPPLRPLRLIPDGVDVLDEITRMLQASRRPLARMGAVPGSEMAAPPRRENDVLDDMRYMICMSRGR